MTAAQLNTAHMLGTVHLLWGPKPWLRAGWAGKQGRHYQNFPTWRLHSGAEASGRALAFCGLHRWGRTEADHQVHPDHFTRTFRLFTCSRCASALDAYLERDLARLERKNKLRVAVLTFVPTEAQLARVCIDPMSLLEAA